MAARQGSNNVNPGTIFSSALLSADQLRSSPVGSQNSIVNTSETSGAFGLPMSVNGVQVDILFTRANSNNLLVTSTIGSSFEVMKFTAWQLTAS